MRTLPGTGGSRPVRVMLDEESDEASDAAAIVFVEAGEQRAVEV